ncbi:MarR family transcriptional regulator [Empedobacter falsenii]|uniref:MarR family transcriptional regulator n=1 Tax=Empedobacter falsenii TaxID=343874 RepID=A0A7H9DRS7_9FLAO|nr:MULTISPECIES: MarR family transcriptional regulator [Empedobacter]HBX63330.1 MarR family transcriptional regulator [Flavobacteriaceae bacterium]MDH0675780.1 MarR family transcriptional regulator [Empedobacter sp. GD03861]MDH2208682.1 MarR family transcriptional regulator [Empedobacter sp. GD03644]MDM1064002.1 MarR family transcriptional regulator [Empedobacter falsenii]MDM1548377.1 MarR family transcriptional regulator [Empedobacter falsenii]
MKDTLELDNQFCFPIYALSKKIINMYRLYLDPLDITYPQYLVLMVLWKEQQQTVGQLGEKLFLDSGTLTPLLKRMEQKEMVVRSRNIEDERIVVISLTKKGSALKEKVKDIPEKLLESMAISVDELKQLKKIANKILNKQQ